MMAAMMGISTHVLDTALGRPAEGVAVALERGSGADWTAVGEGVTDADGRVGDLASELEAGVYRLRFDAAAYHGGRGFYPEVVVTFQVTDPSQHHHVPLLLSPFGYSTYRGS
jgi:5-hydroxyisourate hydrolase